MPGGHLGPVDLLRAHRVGEDGARAELPEPVLDVRGGKDRRRGDEDEAALDGSIVAEPDLRVDRQHHEERLLLLETEPTEQVQEAVPRLDELPVRETKFMVAVVGPDEGRTVRRSPPVTSLEHLVGPVEPLRDLDLIATERVELSPFEEGEGLLQRDHDSLGANEPAILLTSYVMRKLARRTERLRTRFPSRRKGPKDRTRSQWANQPQVTTNVRVPVYTDPGMFTVNDRVACSFAGITSGTSAPAILNPGVVVEMVWIVHAAVPVAVLFPYM